MAEGRGPGRLSRLEIFVVVGAVLFVAAAFLPALRAVRGHDSRTVCADHLAALGKAMAAYAADSDGRFPQSGGQNATWQWPIPWRAPTRSAAFHITSPDGTGGIGSISSSLYLLVRGSYAKTGSFVCPADSAASEFKNADVPLDQTWDFGLEPWKHCCYAYQLPFGPYGLTSRSDPGMAVAADRNPWLIPYSQRPRTLYEPDFPPFKGTPEQARAGNSIQHRGDGQNVLFVDGHVAFKDRPYCGLDRDNIYTMAAVSADTGDPRGMFMPAGILPRVPNRRDSYLAQDEIAYQVSESPPVLRADSKDLKQTAVLATLDDPLPEHRNAIWCATFQMAWDRLKQDVIKEPIKVLGAQALADRLNRGQFQTEGIEKESYYAIAGFAEDGIIKQVQSEMAQRFPSEPEPQFAPGYTALPKGILAYAYLSVNVSFKYPYYTGTRPFAFTDSTGRRTNVTSFDTAPEVADANLKNVREQVEILSCKYDAQDNMTGFIVDLCRDTEPYEIILARVPRAGTLADTLATAEKDMADFKNDPDYGELRRLRPIDRVSVPDVLYKLKHSFSELLKKYLGNAGFQDEYFSEAMQTIDFSLSRTGVVLRSEARIGLVASRSARVEKPRHFTFDRPFLICAKKRQADAKPFLVMWVDNAELMPAFPGESQQ